MHSGAPIPLLCAEAQIAEFRRRRRGPEGNATQGGRCVCASSCWARNARERGYCVTLKLILNLTGTGECEDARMVRVAGCHVEDANTRGRRQTRVDLKAHGHWSHGKQSRVWAYAPVCRCGWARGRAHSRGGVHICASNPVGTSDATFDQTAQAQAQA